MLVVGKLWFFSTWITVGRVGLEAGGWGLPAPAALPGILFLKRVAPPSWLEESLVNKCCLFLFCFENKVASPSWLEGALVNKWICFCFWESLFFVWGVWLLYFIFTRQILGGPCQRQTVFLTIIWKSAWYYIQNKIHFFRQPLISNLRIFISPSLWISREKLLSNHRSCLKCIHAKHLKITKHALSNNHLRDATSQKLLSFLS